MKITWRRHNIIFPLSYLGVVPCGMSPVHCGQSNDLRSGCSAILSKSTTLWSKSCMVLAESWVKPSKSSIMISKSMQSSHYDELIISQNALFQEYKKHRLRCSHFDMSPTGTARVADLCHQGGVTKTQRSPMKRDSFTLPGISLSTDKGRLSAPSAFYCKFHSKCF